MRGTATPFFVRGHTARGPWNLLESSLMGIDLLYVARPAPAAAQSAAMRIIAEEALSASCDVWLLHRPEDHELLDGVIIPSRKTGFIHEGALPLHMRPLPADIRCKAIHLSQAASGSESGLGSGDLIVAEGSLQESEGNAYNCFARALDIHDDWEAIYISAMSFEAANRVANAYVSRLFGETSLPKEGRRDDRFLGAATPAGAIDFVPGLTQGLKRYLIKGRAGSGKSTLLKRLAAEGLRRGYDVEVYHCGFDPNSIDMVIVRELGTAVFDSTAPHEYFPDRETDEIIDMYDLCIAKGTDELHADQLAPIQSGYASAMKEAIGHLAEARRLRNAAEQPAAEVVNMQEIADAARGWAAELLRNGANGLRTAPDGTA
ncbi:hypothetical protein [Paenibacillus agaridevorans]|uniref:hypothetical protein n=1 Tax=Paenibacillus agaridevorans TaxID=171404 RepID=UPI0011B1D9ED|nr:hypothetical protein [Paenibacillus agaridevorans]